MKNADASYYAFFTVHVAVDSKLNEIAMSLNNSYAIISDHDCDPPVDFTRKRVYVQFISQHSVSIVRARIKPRYLKRVPKLFVHVTREDSVGSSAPFRAALFMALNSRPKQHVVHELRYGIIYWKHLKNKLDPSPNLHIILSHDTVVTVDQIIKDTETDQIIMRFINTPELKHLLERSMEVVYHNPYSRTAIAIDNGHRMGWIKQQVLAIKQSLRGKYKQYSSARPRIYIHEWRQAGCFDELWDELVSDQRKIVVAFPRFVSEVQKRKINVIYKNSAHGSVAGALEEGLLLLLAQGVFFTNGQRDNDTVVALICLMQRTYVDVMKTVFGEMEKKYQYHADRHCRKRLDALKASTRKIKSLLTEPLVNCSTRKEESAAPNAANLERLKRGLRQEMKIMICNTRDSGQRKNNLRFWKDFVDVMRASYINGIRYESFVEGVHVSPEMMTYIELVVFWKARDLYLDGSYSMHILSRTCAGSTDFSVSKLSGLCQIAECTELMAHVRWLNYSGPKT